ncbi:receptor kinase, partial [Aphelenchoides avenae]
MVESSTPIVLVDDETRAEFSYVPLRANRLGCGRYGVVFKGVCVQSRSEVAIKFVNRHQYGDNKRAHKYFEREVATLKVGCKVSKNVVKLLGSVTNRDSLAIVAEYCEEGSMARWLEGELSKSIDVHAKYTTLIGLYAQI